MSALFKHLRALRNDMRQINVAVKASGELSRAVSRHCEAIRAHSGIPL
ncbi:MAG: hypothetical protein PW791_13640 [Neorhizobium sp.]|jgi:hypothetical protein|nr:hypothetical protein [Neorhizobium sp.]